jgi:DNA-binding NarL/FixJ family response regulator
MSPRMAPVRVVLVEDEPLARENLREYASGVPWLTLVGEASDGAQGCG